MTATQIIFLVVAAVILGSAVLVVTTPESDPRRTVVDRHAVRGGGSVCVAQRGLSGRGAGGHLHWSHRHPVHLCRDADPRGSARPARPQLNRGWWLNAVLALRDLRRLVLDVPELERLLARCRPTSRPGSMRWASWAMPWSHRMRSSCHLKWRRYCCWLRWSARCTWRSAANRSLNDAAFLVAHSCRLRSSASGCSACCLARMPWPSCWAWN